MRSSKFIHGTKFPKHLFTPSFIKSCRNRFTYMFPDCTGNKDTLAFSKKNKNLLNQLGALMANDESGMPKKESNIPAGYTYLGQFIDHDITFDPFSTTDTIQFPGKTMNMRTPCLDLDSVYSGGPMVTPSLYDHSQSGMGIKFLIGQNQNVGQGGPKRKDGSLGVPSDFDLPRNQEQTALIGDPRNDENLIVSQLHCAMLKFHNAVIDEVINRKPVLSKDAIFAEAQRIVIHHYQWIVVNDFLRRILADNLLEDVFKGKLLLFKKSRSNTNPFRLPVEFTIGAYRFGHSMVRDNYDFNFVFDNASFINAFNFVARNRLPVVSNWVVDFNRFFDTGSGDNINMAMKIDTNLAMNLSNLPSGLNEFSSSSSMPNFNAILASRNLVRGLAFKLPSGQCVAKKCKMKPISTLRELLNDRKLATINKLLPKSKIPKALQVSKIKHVSLVNPVFIDKDLNFLLNNKELAVKTPLWYYVLREAETKGKGNQLGPCGGRIIAETFFRMLDEDPHSYLNTPSKFIPTLSRIGGKPSGDFDMADLLNFAGVLSLD